MVQLTCIVTRGGDAGKTSLGNGARVLKSDSRIAAIGAVDELNSYMGVCLSASPDGLLPPFTIDLPIDLKKIQHDLFDVGADLCMPDNADEAVSDDHSSSPSTCLRITENYVRRLDDDVARYNAVLSPLTSFVLPGGSVLSAHLHVARTHARRAVRALVALHQDAPLNPYMLMYVNRLSDVLFVMARAANENGARDVLWTPGFNQTPSA